MLVANSVYLEGPVTRIERAFCLVRGTLFITAGILDPETAQAIASSCFGYQILYWQTEYL